MCLNVAHTRRQRIRGLRGRERLGPGEGLLIPRCRSVHTFGMRFPITVAFLDKDLRVIEVLHMPRRRLTRPRLRARHVLELADGAPVRKGQRLALDAARAWLY